MQELHSDGEHGPFAFTLSLTRWRDRRFEGGETVLLAPWVLNYWAHPESNEVRPFIRTGQAAVVVLLQLASAPPTRCMGLAIGYVQSAAVSICECRCWQATKWLAAHEQTCDFCMLQVPLSPAVHLPFHCPKCWPVAFRGSNLATAALYLQSLPFARVGSETR